MNAYLYYSPATKMACYVSELADS